MLNRLRDYPLTRLSNPGLRIAVVAALVLACACSRAHTETKETLVWRKLGSWSGTGNVQTESFLSETGGMRVTWETRNETRSGAGTFRLSIHSAISGRTLGVAADSRGVGRDISYINEDPHNCYAVVESANIDWSFIVEEAFPAKTTGR